MCCVAGILTKKNATSIDSDEFMRKNMLLFFQSFYAASLYVAVARYWRGFGFMYLFLVMLFVATPFSIRTVLDFNHYINHQLLEPFAVLPLFDVQNGSIVIPKNSPHLFKNKQGDVVSIMASQGNFEDYIFKYPRLMILITPHMLTIKPAEFHGFNQKTNEWLTSLYPHQNFSLSLENIQNGRFKGSDWVESKAIKLLKYSVLPSLYITIIMTSAQTALVILMGIAIMAQFFSRMFFKFKLSYLKTLRVCVVASTPMWTLGFVALSLNLDIPYSSLILSGLFLSYFSYAIYVIRREGLLCPLHHDINQDIMPRF